MKKIAMAVAVLLSLTLLAPATAHAAQPTGFLKAISYAANNTYCRPGYIQVNAAEGVDHWVIEGEQYPAPASGTAKFEFPQGIQADVYAVPQDGYTTGTVKGSEGNPYILQVEPMARSCFPTTCRTDPSLDRLLAIWKERAAYFKRLANRRADRIDRLQAKVKRLKSR